MKIFYIVTAALILLFGIGMKLHLDSSAKLELAEQKQTVVEEELSALKNAEAGLIDELNRLREERGDVREQVRDARAELTELQAEFAQEEEDLESKQTIIDRLLEKVGELEEELRGHQR